MTAVRLEVAATELQRRQGLMYRRSLPRDSGMLLVFDAPAAHPIWMRNVRMPLDLVFLDSNQVVLEVARGEPGSADSIAVPDTRFVVELAAGVARELGVVPGSRWAWT